MADVGATLAAWSSTTANNSPTGGTTISTGLDDNLREIQGAIVRGLHHKGADIASAATTDLGAVEGLFHDITGTTTITSFGTVRAGVWKVIKFEGALTVTHNSTSLILPGALSINTAVGDIMHLCSEGSGNWRCLNYLPSGVPVANVTSTFTPIDSSGALLTFSAVEGQYTRLGNIVIAAFSVTFPVTASGTAVVIGGLPLGVADVTAMYGGVVTYTDSGLDFSIQCINNATTMNLRKNTGAAVTNIELSTKVVRGVVTYRI